MRPLATAPLTVLATRSVALLAALVVVLATATAAPAAGGGGLTGPTSSTPQSAAMTRGLNAGMRQAGIDSGAEVVDLTTGAVLYDHADSVARIPASVEKLYTTSTALERFGSTATVTTALLGQGARVGATWRGALYLRGGGDPTFGSPGCVPTASAR
jgi:D-alanyl-D-alanine carboxypeptidase/D-alanyl-D-alanine-endopeptidase (penicillin-binding protein 4)